MMNKELEALKKHYIQLANNSSFKYTEFEENRFKLLEQALDRKEKLEQAIKIVKEYVLHYVIGYYTLYDTYDDYVEDCQRMQIDKSSITRDEFNILKEIFG